MMNSKKTKKKKSDKSDKSNTYILSASQLLCAIFAFVSKYN